MAPCDNHCRETKGTGTKDISGRLTQDSPPDPLDCNDLGSSEVPNPSTFTLSPSPLGQRHSSPAQVHRGALTPLPR